jgi:hypothetical protein
MAIRLLTRHCIFAGILFFSLTNAVAANAGAVPISAGSVAKSLMMPPTFTVTYQMVVKDTSPQWLIDKTRKIALNDIAVEEQAHSISHEQALANIAAENGYTKPASPQTSTVSLFGNDGNLILQGTSDSNQFIKVLQSNSNLTAEFDLNSNVPRTESLPLPQSLGNVQIYQGYGMFQQEAFPLPGVGVSNEFPLIKGAVAQSTPDGLTLAGMSPVIPHSPASSGQVMFAPSILTVSRHGPDGYSANTLTFYGNLGAQVQWQYFHEVKFNDVWIPQDISVTTFGFDKDARGAIISVPVGLTTFHLLSAKLDSPPIDEFNYKYWLRSGATVTDHTLNNPSPFSYSQSAGDFAEQEHRQEDINRLETSKSGSSQSSHSAAGAFLLVVIAVVAAWYLVARFRRAPVNR